MHAYVLGAGPTGLITAWELLKKKWDVTIIEKEDQVGGLCRSWKYNNYILDTGPHIFHTPEKELAKFWEDEFGDLFVKGEFYSKNVKGKNFDEFYDYPLSYESIKKNFNPVIKKQILNELSKLNPSDVANARTYKEYIDSFVGKTLRKMFYEKYPEKIWGIKTSEMTSEWAPSRIKFRDKYKPFYTDQWAAVGKFGTGCVYDRIKENILKLGGTIQLNETVLGFEKIKNNIYKINTSRKNYDCKDSVVISSLPLSITSYLLGKKTNLKFRGICSVYLFYKKKEILPKGVHWLYYDNERLLFNRITENKKLSKYVCPKDKSFLTAEITYSQGDSFSKINQKKVISLVSNQVEEVKLANKNEIIDTYINYEPFVYPVQYAKYKFQIKKVKNYVEQFKNLYSIGAGGDFNYADSQVIFHKSIDLANMLNTNNKLYNVIKSSRETELNTSIKLGNKIVGKNNPAYIIAEAGINHNGNIEIAKKLILEAKKCGCNAIKLQSFLPNSRVSKKVKSERYVEKVINTEESISELFNKTSLNFKDQEKLFKYANKIKMEIISTPFDFESVDFLEKMKVSFYKIASMDLTNIPLIEYVASKMKPVIISTGMSKLYEIDETVNAFKNTGNSNLILLHCNSSYPSSSEEINLKFMENLKKIYPIPIGYSDHSEDLLSSTVALSRGANIIERHFTLDKKMEGPDHILSSVPIEMKKLVSYSKEIPKIIGDGYKKIEPNEYQTLNSQKKSLYAKIKIRKGQLFSSRNLIIKGPAGGLPPKYYNLIIGKRSNKNIDADHPVMWEDF